MSDLDASNTEIVKLDSDSKIWHILQIPKSGYYGTAIKGKENVTINIDDHKIPHPLSSGG